jgi:hypothetical protein
MPANSLLQMVPNRTFSPLVPWEYFNRLLWLPDSSRNMGIHIMAGKGSGKSRLMGRIIAWLDFIRGVPQVIFDPHGPTIDNFLDKLLRLPPELQARLIPRVQYIDMSGHSGYIFPFPLYYRNGAESLYEVSQRFLDVVRKIDPYLQTASVEGWNALWRTGTYTGMILSALNYQISEAEGLLSEPSKWEVLLDQAMEHYPEILPAVQYLKELERAKENIRNRRTESFFNKIALFSLDPSMKAMFGAPQPGLDWNEVISQHKTILLDFRHEHDLERRRFKMVWAFNYFLDFIKQRGAGRHRPIGLVIDELTSLFSVQALASDLFGSELDELINVIARNYSVWLTIAHQEMFQITERIIKSLMTMGTQILGVTTDPEGAKYLAQIYFKYNPYLVKKIETVYGSLDGFPIALDHRTVEFTTEEQLILQSYQFIHQRRFRFLAKPATREGDYTGELRAISIENLDRDIYPDEKKVSELRHIFMQQNGLLVEDVLDEISKRLLHGAEAKALPAGLRKSKPAAEEQIPFWG